MIFFFRTLAYYAGAYGLWQYSWTGSLPGISGDVDLDYAYIDYPSIIKNAGLNGFAKNTTTATDKPNEDTEKDTNNNDTLKQILQHIASIDGKLNG